MGLAGEMQASLRVLLVLSLLEHDWLELPCGTQRPPPQGCCPVLPDVQLKARRCEYKTTLGILEGQCHSLTYSLTHLSIHSLTDVTL